MSNNPEADQIAAGLKDFAGELRFSIRNGLKIHPDSVRAAAEIRAEIDALTAKITLEHATGRCATPKHRNPERITPRGTTAMKATSVPAVDQIHYAIGELRAALTKLRRCLLTVSPSSLDDVTRIEANLRAAAQHARTVELEDA